jgi:hypothetical protein
LIEAKVREDTKHGPVEEAVGARTQPVAREGAKGRPEAEVAAEAPVGSRVTFGTYPIFPGQQPHKDNTVKMAKDVYAAHDVPEGTDAMYTREDIAEKLRFKYDAYGAIPAKNVFIVAIEVYNVEEMTKMSE